jgi:NAD(P)-dependent dehydrogenase (short-subunit alcohol dehydrogenase family)
MVSDTKRSTPQGIELQMGVNVVAPYLLTELLLPMLKASNGRVVFVASEAHQLCGAKRIDLDYFRNFETRPHDPSVNYQQVCF